MGSVMATRDLQNELVANQNLPEEQLRKVLQLKDLLDKMIALDPVKRISINQALLHPFLTERMA